MCYKKIVWADPKHQKKKLNLCMWHITEALESSSTALHSYRYHAQQVLIKSLQSYAYEVQLLQALNPEGMPPQKRVCSEHAGQARFISRVYKNVFASPIDGAHVEEYQYI